MFNNNKNIFNNHRKHLLIPTYRIDVSTIQFNYFSDVFQLKVCKHKNVKCSIDN